MVTAILIIWVLLAAIFVGSLSLIAGHRAGEMEPAEEMEEIERLDELKHHDLETAPKDGAKSQHFQPLTIQPLTES